MSGKVDENEKTQPNKQNEKGGPIPAGWYTADPNIVQKWSDLSITNKFVSSLPAVEGFKHGAWPGGTFAWGEFRVPLFPLSVGSRGNFFIHGGSRPGSAGCIDLTKNMNAFVQAFIKYNQILPLHVKY